MALKTAPLLVRNADFFIIVVILLSVFQPSTEQACRTNQFRCDDGDCVAQTSVCDYFDNCGDNSDERNCEYPTPDKTKALVCTVNSPTHQYSFMHKLFGDPDQYAYKFGNNAFAGRLPIQVNRLSIQRYDFFHAVSIDYDMQLVYYSNNDQKQLNRGLFIHNNNTRVLYFYAVPETSQMNGVAIDWVTKNVYWTDGLYNVIGVLVVISRHRVWKAIVDKNLTSPQDIVVNPVLRYLFWSDGNGRNAKIERSDLSGKNRIVLVTSAQGLVSPTTLVVDFSTQKLYWLDSGAQKIGRVNFDGSQRLYSQTISMLSQVSAMTIYRNYVYFGSNQSTEIYIYNKTSFTRISSYRLPLSAGSITDMAMFASDMQPSATSPCAARNGGCTHFCWTTSSTSRVCDCALGFFLASDGATCTSRPFSSNKEYLVVADHLKQNIYQLKPDSGEVRALTMNPCHPVSVTFDPSINGLYMTCDEKITGITSRTQYRIRKKTFDGRIDQVVYNAPLDSSQSKLLGLTLDAGRGMLYYTDMLRGIIGNMKVSGTNQRVIFSDGSKRPRAIVVDSDNRRLYWTDCSGPATIQTANVDGTDHRTPIRDYNRTCIVGIAIDFTSKLMYWATEDNPAVIMASLNGTNQVILFSESEASYTGITLYKDCLYISDKTRRNIIKYNLTSRTRSRQVPGLFVEAYDVKYFNTSRVTRPTVRSTVVTGVTTTPMISSTSSSPVSGVTGVTATPMISSTSSSPGDEDGGQSVPLIVGVAAGVGGFLILLVIVVTAVIVICIIFRKRRRPTESRSHVSRVFTVPSPRSMPMSYFGTYDEIPGAEGGLDKRLDSHAYEPLGQKRYSSDPPPSPPARTTDKPPPPPVKPKPRGLNESRKDYLHFTRDED